MDFTRGEVPPDVALLKAPTKDGDQRFLADFSACHGGGINVRDRYCMLFASIYERCLCTPAPFSYQKLVDARRADLLCSLSANNENTPFFVVPCRKIMQNQ
ncbi:unnamed protein product [Dibothriocephalus latus]|uniref:Uncharacterized protein n=1 Tax=Dibothriocephalus latus TaxID=60516 RepID=A0A3P6QQK2_DIBLA|nr:unnamed protein product [Dibothriocephalus latus]